MDSLNSLVPRAVTELLRSGPLSQGKLDLAWRVAVGEALSRVSTAHLQPDGVVEVRPSDVRMISPSLAFNSGSPLSVAIASGS